MPSDAVQFLANSPDRLALLASLSEGPASPSELASEHSFARRSVQRHLSAFVDRGWAESGGGTYRLTVSGEFVAEEHAEYVDALDRIEAFAPFFRYLPDRDHAPDPTWLDGASIARSTDEVPQAPVYRYVDAVKRFDADSVRMLSPVLSRLFHEAHASLALGGTRTELVLPARMVERARERNPLEFDGVVALDVLSLYRHPEPFSVGLTLGGDRLLMGAYDDEMRLRALVESGNSAFRAWAADLWEEYRDRSERVRR